MTISLLMLHDQLRHAQSSLDLAERRFNAEFERDRAFLGRPPDLIGRLAGLHAEVTAARGRVDAARAAIVERQATDLADGTAARRDELIGQLLATREALQQAGAALVEPLAALATAGEAHAAAVRAAAAGLQTNSRLETDAFRLLNQLAPSVHLAGHRSYQPIGLEDAVVCVVRGVEL